MLKLTTITKSDIEKQVTWWDDPKFYEYLETKSNDFQKSWKYATSPCRECFSIKLQGLHIGAISVNQPNNNVSIIIDPEWWGVGMATKALKLLSDRDYTAGIRSHNIGSLIAFLKNGFVICDAVNGVVRLRREKGEDIEVNFGF